MTVDEPEIQAGLPDADPDAVTSWADHLAGFTAVPKTMMWWSLTLAAVVCCDISRIIS